MLFFFSFGGAEAALKYYFIKDYIERQETSTTLFNFYRTKVINLQGCTEIVYYELVNITYSLDFEGQLYFRKKL